MEQTTYKSLTLILARDLAENLATPLFMVDAAGALVFYNEPAERLLGRRFSEIGELPMEEWATMWALQSASGRPLQVAETPLGIALMQRQPAHDVLLITGLDGSDRRIGVTAFPLFASATEFAGAIAIFWEQSE